MVVYETGTGKNRRKISASVGMGPFKITSAKPNLSRQVASVKKSVKEIQKNEELKYKDVFLNGQALTSTATLTLLNGMQLGDDVSNRTGNQISPTSIQFRCAVRNDVDRVSAGTVFRHIIFWDSQANGAAPTSGDLLDAAVTTQLTIAPYKREYQKRFKVVYDKAFTINPNFATIQDSGDTPAAPTAVFENSVYYKKKRSLSRITKYRNAQNAGTIADIASNSLYSLWVSQAATDGGSVDCGYRMYFKDD